MMFVKHTTLNCGSEANHKLGLYFVRGMEASHLNHFSSDIFLSQYAAASKDS